MQGLVVAHVLTFNSESTILACLNSLLQQNGLELGLNYEVWISDNNSLDRTREVINSNFSGQIKVLHNTKNLGFSRAHNEAISRAINLGAEYFFVANPDLILEADALISMITAINENPRAGCCSPKILRADQRMQPVRPSTIDAAGMYFTKNMRHFDRGSGQLDYGQFDNMEYVSGGTGAALLLKRDFILDSSISYGSYYELFDDTFFAYREDADLAWRALWLGWRCVYQPRALAYHQRRVLPDNRAQLPPELNSYSVRNRFLMQFKNATLAANYHCIFPTMFRNLLVIAGVLICERSSLPGLAKAVALLPQMLDKRQHYRSKRRESSLTVSRHFSTVPYHKPILTETKLDQRLESLAIIVVSYQSGDRLRSCLRQLNSALAVLKKRLPVKIAIVDNDKQSQIVDELEKQYVDNTELVFYRPGENLGFAGAICYARSRLGADSYLILNPDVIIDAQTILELIRCLDKYDNLAIISPLLMGTDGLFQRSYTLRRLPSIRMLMAEIFLLNRLFPHHRLARLRFYEDDQLIDDYLYNRFPHVNEPYEHREQPLVVEQPAGACMLIKDSLFNSIGCFSEEFWPAWFEDVDLCKRAKEAGYLSAITRKVKAVHEGGYSRKVIRDSVFYQHYYGNMFRYVKKHETFSHYILFRFLAAVGLFFKSVVVLLLSDIPKIISAQKGDHLSFASFRLWQLIFAPIKGIKKQNS
ncbi:MAG: glycosyltransferase [Deltaproteobacteria bacterium]|nr:glycosyltransferase [Deltaproteobacteria bacterium]